MRLSEWEQWCVKNDMALRPKPSMRGDSDLVDRLERSLMVANDDEKPRDVTRFAAVACCVLGSILSLVVVCGIMFAVDPFMWVERALWALGGVVAGAVLTAALR